MCFVFCRDLKEIGPNRLLLEFDRQFVDIATVLAEIN